MGASHDTATARAARGTARGVKHPAKFSDAILPTLADMLHDVHGPVVDPMGGVGRLREVCPSAIIGDIEWQWVAWAKEYIDLSATFFLGGAVQWDAHALPLPDASVAAIVTSPTYGNRMADHHNAQDGTRRITYAHVAREQGWELDKRNSGLLQWGEEYRTFHYKAWREVKRVLKPGGKFIVNLKNHPRNKKVVNVVKWHYEVITGLGFDMVQVVKVGVPGMKFREDNHQRVEVEYVMEFERG